MDITYKNNKIKKVCTDAKTAERTYGREMADKIHQRIDEIGADLNENLNSGFGPNVKVNSI